jgi:Flp pilus assembly protein TadG
MIRNRNEQRRNGAVLVELAFVAVICITLMFAIFEYGRTVMMRQIMENAVRAGARSAVVTPTSYIAPAAATTQIQNLVINELGQVQLSDLQVTIYQADSAGNNVGPWTQAPFGRNIVVQLDADMPLMFPTFGFLPHNSTTTPNAIHITTRSMMRGEAN